MPKGVNVPDAALKGRLTHGFFDDFDHFVTADRWTVTATNSGGATVSDAVGGRVTIDTSDSTVADNDETYLHTTTETFLLAAAKPLVFDARIQFSEANTDDANVIVGLMDAVAADSVQDNGAGPDGTFDGAVLYKVDGGTVWRFMTSNATTQVDSVSTTTAGGASFQVLTIEVIEQSSTKCKVIPKVDGVQLKDTNGNLISHELTYSGLAEMAAVVGVKNGSTNEETVVVDYVSCWQTR